MRIPARYAVPDIDGHVASLIDSRTDYVPEANSNEGGG